MDYIDLLKEQCPPAIVEYVTRTDMTAFGKNPWPNDDFTGAAVSDPCHIAALLYRSSVLPKDLYYAFADYLVRDIDVYFGQITDQDRALLVAAMRQIAARPQLPQSYFNAVTRHRIDVEDVLKTRFAALPQPEAAIPGARFEAYAYLRYLTAMGDKDALNSLTEALRLEPSPAIVTTELAQIRNLRLPQANAIFQAFINDTRQSLSAQRTPGVVVANTVRRYLGLPSHEGPFQPLEANGQPFQEPTSTLR